MLRTWLGPLRLMLCMLVVITLVYCIGISFLGYGLFYQKSEGSLVYQHHQVIASKLMGQQFRQDQYFWPRQSMTNYQNDLITPNMIAEKNREYWHMTSHNFPSASQVDPDIRLEDAYAQMRRVAKVRNIAENKLLDCMKTYTKTSFLGFGESRVNVLLLNLALDKKMGRCHD